MLHHVVELHSVAIELSQATRGVKRKTLDSLPVGHPNPAGVQRENLIAFSSLKYLYYIPIYLPLVFEGGIYESINNVFIRVGVRFCLRDITFLGMTVE
jgi:hypothetical protein